MKVPSQRAPVNSQAEPIPPRPTASYPDGWVDQIPDELKQGRFFVAWRYEYRANKGGNGKWTKVPYKALPLPRGLRRRPKAKADTPSTWTTFPAALAAYRANAERADDERLDGVGREFDADDGLVGGDFDNCLSEDGKMQPWAAERLKRLGISYAETSPSRRGVKVFYRGTLAAKPDGTTGRRRGGYGPDGTGEIELYDRARYFTLTGDAWWPDQSTIAEADPEALAALVAELDQGNAKKGGGRNSGRQGATEEGTGARPPRRPAGRPGPQVVPRRTRRRGPAEVGPQRREWAGVREPVRRRQEPGDRRSVAARLQAPGPPGLLDRRRRGADGAAVRRVRPGPSRQVVRSARLSPPDDRRSDPPERRRLARPVGLRIRGYRRLPRDPHEAEGPAR
jgi:hypothetical protein